LRVYFLEYAGFNGRHFRGFQEEDHIMDRGHSPSAFTSAGLSRRCGMKGMRGQYTEVNAGLNFTSDTEVVVAIKHPTNAALKSHI